MAQPNPEFVAGLREEVTQYKTVDDRLRVLNKEIHTLRQEKKVIEDRIVHILEQPGFTHIEELAISQDGSKIRIRKPHTWGATWTMSKTALQTQLNNYFNMPNIARTAQECYEYIVRARLRELSQDKHALERIVKDADE